MDYKERYNEWLLFDDDTKQELLKNYGRKRNRRPLL